MNNRRLRVVAIIFACLILGWFALTAPHTRDIREPAAPSAASKKVPTVALHDAYKKGTHTITGSIEVPNACTTVTADASLAGNGILVSITMPQDSGICLERSEDVRFTASIAAPADLPITATVNGAAATTTSL